MSDSVKKSGFFVSLRQMLATVLEIAQVRFDLLCTEIELEKRRLFYGLIWVALSLLALGLGLVMLCGFVVLLFWEGYRLAALGTMTLLFLVSGVLFLREARRHFFNPNGIFSESLAELERDKTGLKAPKKHEQR